MTTHRTFDRRALTKGSLIVGAAALLGGRTGVAPRRAAAQDAGRLADLRIGVAGLPETMDPQETSTNVGNRVNYSVFDMPIRRDYLDGNRLVPWLATEWVRIDDLTFELTLREDVLFHDGTPVTAADAAYTYNRLAGEAPDTLSTSFWPVANAEAIDDYRVRIVTSQVDPVLESRFAGPGSQIIPARYHQEVGVEAFRTRPIGTGPYRVAEFTVGDRLTLEAFEGYYGDPIAAERVTFRQIPETATRMAALINGEVDIITNVPPDQAAFLEGEGLTVKSAPLTNIHVLFYNSQVPPLDRPEIRRALNLAIDRQALVDDLWLGFAVHTRGIQFEGEAFYNPDRPLTAYDPERARALLDEAGYADEEIRYVFASPNYYTNESEAAQAILEMWRQVGINGVLEPVEDSQKDALFQSGEYHVTTGSNTSFVGDPDHYLWVQWGAGGRLQSEGMWTPAGPYNTLGEEARTTLDRDTRYRNYQQMLDLLEEEAPGTSLYVPAEIYGMQQTIDWTPYSYYYMDLRAYNFRVRE